MERRLASLCLLALAIFRVVSAFKIQNKLLGKCLQAHGGRVSLADCTSYSTSLEWHWLAESSALSSQLTGECLTSPGEQYEGVQLKPCIIQAGILSLDMEAKSQAWSCSKKGHLTLMRSGLHLGATQESTLVFLSREHKQGSRWRALENQTLCSQREKKHDEQLPSHHERTSLETNGSLIGAEVTESYTGANEPLLSLSTKSPSDPTMIFFTMDYGMGWKITMLILSSLALVLGTVILILNVYSNRRKKVVCVLKSYTPRPDASIPGSPVPSERAPLTEHAMHLPHSTPTLQRGEILIQWKDGTVTPLYEA